MDCTCRTLAPIIAGAYRFFSPEECPSPAHVLEWPGDASREGTTPFRVTVRVRTEHGAGAVEARATVDDGAMMCVVDSVFLAGAESVLGKPGPSPLWARLADGTVRRSEGRVKMAVTLSGVEAWITAEVIDTRGAFQVLLGKPWKAQAGVTHDYRVDRLTMRADGESIEVGNDETRTRGIPETRDEEEAGAGNEEAGAKPTDEKSTDGGAEVAGDAEARTQPTDETDADEHEVGAGDVESGSQPMHEEDVMAGSGIEHTGRQEGDEEETADDVEVEVDLGQPAEPAPLARTLEVPAVATNRP
jgi:hypothetical protein